VRLFLALEPPQALRERLGELADVAKVHCGGRRVPDESLHLTLAFLGEVPEARTEALSAWVARRPVSPGEWRLDAWGTFRGPGIVWVGGRWADRSLVQLHESLWDELEAFGFSDGPRHFMPHVTLLRRARQLETRNLPAVDLTWPWRRLSLVRSFTDNEGARYETLARSSAG